jgi:hypothetical protein
MDKFVSRVSKPAALRFPTIRLFLLQEQIALSALYTAENSVQLENGRHEAYLPHDVENRSLVSYTLRVKHEQRSSLYEQQRISKYTVPVFYH